MVVRGHAGVAPVEVAQNLGSFAFAVDQVEGRVDTVVETKGVPFLQMKVAQGVG